jgi:hypothetical protein
MNIRLAAMVALGASALAPAASADLITFIHEGYGGGTLDGVGFGALAPVHFVITATGDTANRANSGATSYEIVHDAASIAIDGVGTFDFITPTRTFVNPAIDQVGFARGSGTKNDLFDGPMNAAFGAWDMLSSIGPFNGNDGFLVQWDESPVDTTGGVLFFNQVGDINATFTAIVVPTPAIIALAPISALTLTRRRRW